MGADFSQSAGAIAQRGADKFASSSLKAGIFGDFDAAHGFHQALSRARSARLHYAGAPLSIRSVGRRCERGGTHLRAPRRGERFCDRCSGGRSSLTSDECFPAASRRLHTG
ncbi:DUF2563 family protein [Mycobacterium adipatum]